MRPFLAPAAKGEPEAAVQPSFSVAIAAYQAEAIVGDAIESALAQTVPAVEVIVCDDGSTDGTGAAIERFGSRVTHIRKENGGEASAKNAAARAARGDFVVFLDADDLFEPERLAALGELAAHRPDLDILTTDALLELDGRVARRCYDASFPFEVDDQRRAILERNFLFGLAAVRRSRLREAGGFDEEIPYATDWDLWLRLIMSGARAGMVDEPLARYRISGGLSSHRARLFEGRARVIAKALEREHLEPHERRAAEHALAEQRKRAALEGAREALVERRPDARRRSLDVALGPGHTLPSRLKALVSAAAPGLAGRRLADRPRETTAGLLLPD
ncbi:MAG TPA: glycosyltransferase [Thermoleophilaceae bacterium]